MPHDAHRARANPPLAYPTRGQPIHQIAAPALRICRRQAYAPPVDELAIRASWRVGLDEVSALAFRPGGAGGPSELLGVSDKSFSLFIGSTQPPGIARLSPDISSAIRDWALDPLGGSQWEGLATDEGGRVLVLQEHAGSNADPSHVFGFGPELDQLLLVIELVVDERRGSRWRESWREDKNARGEALVLLRDGHLLVAKQKDPVRLIEFGPRGTEAGGIGPSRLLPREEPFSWPTERVAEYEALASWGVSGDDVEVLESVNDLAVHDGELFAISRNSRIVVRLEPAPTEDCVKVEHRWRVPDDVRNPEGLVLPDAGLWIVADDVGREDDDGGDRHNIFVVEPSWPI